MGARQRALAVILDAPPGTRSVFARRWRRARDRWRALVDRGLFVFAAYRTGGPYWIAEAPYEPLHVLELPALAGELLARLPRLALPFKHMASVVAALGLESSGARGREPH